MAVDSFRQFVLDQLDELPELRIRSMFGGHGLYCQGRFFAILDEDRLYFKTDEHTRGDYLARGMGPFTYESQGRILTMGYHEVPPEVLENARELVDWARRAVAIAAQGTRRGGPSQTKHPDASSRARRS